MKLWKFVFIVIVVCYVVGLYGNTPPVVTNVSASQRTDGSKIVDIWYNVSDADNDTLSVSLKVSNNNGVTFSVTPSPANLSGAIGNGILSGTNKHIIWNAGAEAVIYDSNQFKVKVVAEEMVDLTTGLVAYYPFNGNANDESGNGHDGVINGAIGTLDRFGIGNKALYFSLGNFVQVANSSSLNPEYVTMCAWIKYQYGGTFSPRIISKVTDNYGNACTGYEIYTLTTEISRSPSIRIGIYGTDRRIENTPLINQDEWHFIVGMYNGEYISIYCDGELIGYLAQNGVVTPNAIDLYIGKISRSGDDWFVGTIDDIRIYNRPLSNDEIQALYHEGGWPNTKGMK